MMHPQRGHSRQPLAARHVQVDQRPLRRLPLGAPLPVEHVQVRNLGPVLGIEFSNELLRPENRIVKRMLDIILGSVFLVIAAPIIFVCGLMVKTVSRGPMFYVQEREGLDGNKIRMWKLRTMYVDAERRLEDHLAANPGLRSEWESKCKLARDPRVVRGVGRFLRRFSIDELPQLWCVVTGTMSLVGPRPFLPEQTELYGNAARYVQALPGITGLWQVSGRNQLSFVERAKLDENYLLNRSFWMDLRILWQTIWVTIEGRGAY